MKITKTVFFIVYILYPLFGFAHASAKIKMDITVVQNWFTNCHLTPETEGNVYPKATLFLSNDNKPIGNARIYLASDGDILDLIDKNKTSLPCERDKNNILFVTTDKDGNATITFDMILAGQPNINKNPSEGLHYLVFTYFKDGSDEVMAQRTMYFHSCDGCTDCWIKDEINNQKKQSNIDIANQHLYWALSDLGPCTRTMECAKWTRQYNIEGHDVIISRLNSTARTQIIRALAAIHASKVPGYGNKNYDDLAFDLVLSTQIHNQEVTKWMNENKGLVLEALMHLPVYDVLVKNDIRTILHDMFGF